MKVSVSFYLLVVSILLSMLSTACRQVNKLPISKSPRGIYQQHILDSPLAKKKIAQNWITAADTALTYPTAVSIPFQSKSVYFSDETYVWSWKFFSTEGRIIQADLDAISSSHNIFMDLFALKNNDTLLVASTKDSVLSYEVDQSGSFILRLQPELLINGSFTLKITDRPSMIFPVAGAKLYDIGGRWGDPRDGGDRSHRGIDIFAKRHTPAIAASDGRVRKAGNNTLGGNVIWLNSRQRSLYYAHLDSILIRQGAKVQAGDTLGLVGTSGNARSTPPHLHFGIYGLGSTVDPLPFVADANDDPKPIAADPTLFNKWGRLHVNNANIRPTPSSQEENIAMLNRYDAIKILGGVGTWYQIQLPNGRYGFINKRFVEPVSRMALAKTKNGASLFKNYNDLQPSFRIDSTQKLDLFATFNNHQLSKYHHKWVWIK